MKKLIFISLLVAITYCKAADSDESWHQAIQHIPNWKQTDTLDLKKSKIKTIPAGLNLSQLTWLDLNKNLIKTIPAGLNLSQLKWLALNYNQIEMIPAYLNLLPQLRMLDLTNNQIKAIEDLSLQRLETLDLRENQINAIKHLNLPWLETLDLRENKLDEFIIYFNLPQLRELFLSGNQIEYIDPGIFERFPNLEEIHLNRNPLSQSNVDQLRKAAAATGRNIEIIADDIGNQYHPGYNIKGN